MDRAVPITLPAGGALITRRRMLTSAGVALAGVGIGTGLGVVHPAIAVAPRAGLRRSDYVSFVGHSFQLTGANGRLSVPLAAVEDLPAPRGLAGSEEAFILVFHAPRGATRWPQSVVAVRHPRGFSQHLLVSPAGTGRRGQDYAVVINRANPR